MDPPQIFCHNPDCPASGKVGWGNIGVDSRKQQRYICHECKTTFTQSKGTPFYRLRYSVEVVTQVIIGLWVSASGNCRCVWYR